MNAHVQTERSGNVLSREQKRTNYQPVFDPDGNIIGIQILEHEHDAVLGSRAIGEWYRRAAETLCPHTRDISCRHSGFSPLQRTLLETPPPAEIHVVRASERWNPLLNRKVATPSVILPVPHLTEMFERIFPFQYSIEQEVGEVQNEVVTASYDGHSGIPKAAGTAYYATAKYRIILDLDGRTRTFEGIGTNFTSVGANGEAGAGLVASTATFVQRAALTEAMRNCYDRIGPCFRRAFSDGSQQFKHLERILLLELKGLAHEARQKE